MGTGERMKWTVLVGLAVVLGVALAGRIPRDVHHDHATMLEMDEDQAEDIIRTGILNRTAILDESAEETVPEFDFEKVFQLTSDPEASGSDVMTFAKRGAMAHYHFPLYPNCYVAHLKFRTAEPHGLLLMLKFGEDFKTSMFLHHGFLTVRQTSRTKRQTFKHSLGGLNDNEEHDVKLLHSCDAEGLSLVLDSDGQSFETEARQDAPSELNIFLGGSPQWFPEGGQFTGCLKEVTVRGWEVEEYAAIARSPPHHAHHITSGPTCEDKCIPSPCPHYRCTNRYSHAECDCSGSGKSGPHCDQEEDGGEFHFPGGGFLRHNIFSWAQATHLCQLDVRLEFMTNTSKSVVVEVLSEEPEGKVISVAVDEGGHLLLQTNLEMESQELVLNMDNEPVALGTKSETTVLDGRWHSVWLRLNSKQQIRFKPRVIFGNTLNKPLTSDQALEYHLSFLGNMRQIYVNGRNVLADLGSSDTAYEGFVEDSAEQLESYRVSLKGTSSSFSVPPEPADAMRTNLRVEVDFLLNAEHPRDNLPYVLAHGQLENDGKTANWKVYRQGLHLLYHDEASDVTLLSVSDINEFYWNRLELFVDEEKIYMMLNGYESELENDSPPTFSSTVYIGSQLSGEKSLACCVENLNVNGETIELREYAGHSDLHLGPCQANACAEDVCQNGGTCTGDFTQLCDCSHTNYEGDRCQYRKFLSSCEEYRRHGFEKSARYMIKLEGEDQAWPFMCNFEEDFTETVVTHNLPDNKRVRDIATRSQQISIDYEGLSPRKLESLVDRSDSCSQYIRFNCRHTRLDLSSMTMFSSPKKEHFSNFGLDYPAMCPCYLQGGCHRKDLQCNCDAGDDEDRFDEAVMKDKNLLPLTAMSFFVNREDMAPNSKQTVALGDLKCVTEEEPEDAVSVLNCHSPLELPYDLQKEEKLHSLGLAFRTYATDGVIIHKPAHTSEHADITVILQNPHQMDVLYKHTKLSSSVSFTTEADHPINSRQWHYLWLDVSPTQLRITFNGHVKYISLEGTRPILESDIYIGGSPKDTLGAAYEAPAERGLAACYKGLTINDKKVSLGDLMETSAPGSRRKGCQLYCDPNPCQYGGVCEEVQGGGHTCSCSNVWAHSGENCQNNVNENVVTLINRRTALRLNPGQQYSADELDALTQDVSIAFRTREIQAMLVYTEDKLGNMAQLYMSSPHTITLLWSHGNEMRAINVHTTGDVDLNMGDLVQVHVDRSEGVTVHVMIHDQVFTESHEEAPLHRTQHQHLPYGSHIPHPDAPLRNYRPTQDIVLVGAASADGLVAKIPGLLGCVSGFKINSLSFRLDDSEVWDYNGNPVDMGCHTTCERHNPCQHGGRCLDVFDNSRGANKECDCQGTSYEGEFCDEETAYLLNGTGQGVSMGPLYPLIDEQFSLEFGFALNQMDAEREDVLLEYEVLSADQSERSPVLEIRVVGTDLQITSELGTATVTPTSVYLRDSYRHSVHLSVAGVKIDGYEVKSEDIAFPEGGDTLYSTPTEGAEYSTFTIGGDLDGCVSNVRLETVSMKFYTPLHDFDGEVDNSTVRGQCGTFSSSTYQQPFHLRNHVEYLHNGSKPQAETYIQYQDLHDPYQHEQQDHSAPRLTTLAKIGAVFIVVMFCGTFFYMWKIHRNMSQAKAERRRRSSYKLLKLQEERKEAARKELEDRN